MSRIRSSSFYEMFFDYDKEKLDVEAIDTIMNLFTLVCALVFTIPFSMLQNLDIEAMDRLSAVVLTCVNSTQTQIEDPFGVNFKTNEEADEFVKRKVGLMSSAALLAVYFPLIGIALGMWYYLLRPGVKRDNACEVSVKHYEKFKLWWSRGRFLVLTVASCMCLGIVADLFLSNMYYANFVTSSKMYCKFNAFTSAWITTLIVVVVAFFIFA